jgi:hypothetical protein
MAADRQAWIYRGLTAVGILLLVAIYFAPIWWVSLTAPNYPAEAFPDGVRIHFHANGVFNGCEKVAKTEITEVEALDCVHEMDTINHYVGMYPIAAGGVIERAFSPYLFSLLGIMLVGFMVGDPKRRTLVMGIGFAALAAWMYLGWYTADGLKYQNAGYVEALVTALDQDTSSDPEVVSSGNAIVDRLRASLEASGVKVDDGKPDQSLSGKARNLQHLRVTFDKDQERRPGDERMQWDGSGLQMMSWHYEKSLARYFNVAAEIEPRVAGMTAAGHIVFWGLLAAMLFLLVATRRNGSTLYWLLVAPSVLLPVFFIIDYSAWLWWYGHTLNDMGAFTVKPFMPTVFGDGKVAQFTTHSYPHIGFGLMALHSVIVIFAANRRFRQLTES